MEQSPNLLSKKENNSPDKKRQNMFGIALDKKRKRYIVRLAHEDGKPLILKDFSFKGKNTPAQALEKAIRFRNKKVRDFLLECTANRANIELKNNQTGVTGVYRREKIRKNGEKAGIYVATWYNKENKLEKMEFTENKWGAKEAFFMAWATRLRKSKIFKKDKITKQALYDPKQSFDIVYDTIGKSQAEKIWEKENLRVKQLKITS